MFLQRSLSRFAIQRPDFCCRYVPYESPCLSYHKTEKANAPDSDKPLEPIEKEIHIIYPSRQTKISLSYLITHCFYVNCHTSFRDSR